MPLRETVSSTRRSYFSRLSAALSLVTAVAFAMVFTTGVARADDYTTTQSCYSVSFSNLTRTGDGATLYKALVISSCQDCVKQGKLFRYLTKGAANDTGTCLVAPPVTPPPVTPPPVTPPPVAPVAGESYFLIAKHSGKALQVASESQADGGQVTQWTKAPANDNFKWKLEDAGGGYYFLIAKHSGKALQVASESQADGGQITQWTKAPANDNFKWKFELVK